jgi:hypothetical protein
MLPGDVCQFSEDEVIVVIGVLVSNHSIGIVARNAQRFVTEIPIDEIGGRFPLFYRPNRPLRSIAHDGRTGFLDGKWIFGGLRAGDRLDNGLVLIGTSGKVVLAVDPAGQSHPIDWENANYARNGRPLIRLDLVEKEGVHFAEKWEVDRVLVLHSNHGAGLLLASDENSFFVQFQRDGRKVRTIPRDSPLIQFANVNDDDFLTEETEIVRLSGNDPRTLDLVATPRGFGTVAGVTPTGKVGVWLEESQANFGCITMVDPSDVQSIARLFGQLIVDGCSANSADFADYSVLPGDELRTGEIVVGIKDGAIFGRVRDGPLVQLDPRSKPVRRRVFAFSGDADPKRDTFFLESAVGRTSTP